MKVTMRDIAKQANVSLATVSRALSGNGYVKDETMVLILDACEALNYKQQYNQLKAAKNRANLIGVMTADLGNEFNIHVIDGLTALADQNGYEVVIYDAQEKHEREERALNVFSRLPLRGLILTPVMDPGPDYYEFLGRLEQLKIPVVLVDRDLKYSHFDAVFLDNIKGASEAVEAFIKCGHKKIATISGVESSLTGRDRLAGYKKIMKIHGIPLREEYMVCGEFTGKGAYEAMHKLMDYADPPTAVFVANSVMMTGALKAIREREYNIPEDIAVISFDDISDAKYNTKCSVVAQPMTEMGEKAMEILLDRLRSPYRTKNDSIRIVLSPKLILRGSEQLVTKKQLAHT